jgi:tetratricopeptide (TPR) repeat protein
MSSNVFMALLARDYLRAADLYFQKGQLRKASEMYERGGNLQQAARLAVELGDIDRAVACYVQAHEPRLAGELLAAHARHKDAIGHFEQAGAFWQAAESATALQQPARAARYFERAGAWAAAAANYEKANQLEDAARALGHEQRRLEELAKREPTQREEVRNVGLRRAELLNRLGRGGEAGELLVSLGLPARAAPLLERARSYTAAVRAYFAAGQMDAAARLLDRAPDVERELAAQIYARTGRSAEAADLLARQGRPAEAAEAYERAGDALQAAVQWEAAHEPDRAGEAYVRAGRFEDAGRCYSLAGNAAAAADAWARTGRHLEAAALFAKLGQHLKAAKHYLEGGDRAAASIALQQVSPGTPNFERATLLLVPLLLEDGLPEAAVHRLRMLPNDTGLTSTGTLDRVYWEARVLEALGRPRDAAASYEKLLALRRGHRDAEARLGALREARVQEDTTAATMAVPTQTGALAIGVVLAGRYEIIGELGRGGMSRVYRARDRELGEVVAIKTLLRRDDDERGDEERLLREVQICRRITHPNVVRVYDIGRFAGGIFVTMELIEGKRLDRLLKESGPLPLARARGILSEVAAGLREAHALDIVHRDLKPGNVMLTPGRLKILDFGIAHMAAHKDHRLTQTGEAMGSPMYMSPEQIQGLALDGRSDLYSLGVLAFTLLTGREPFGGPTPGALALQHLQTPAPDLRTLRPEAPAEWAAFVARLLAKRPDERYASAQEVLEAVATLPD